MKTARRFRLGVHTQRARVLIVLAFTGILGAGLSAFAVTNYWDTSTTAGLQGGNGTWDTGVTALWSTSSAGSSPLVTWSDWDDAFFQATVEPKSYTNTLSGTISARSITKVGQNNRVVLKEGTLRLGEGGLVNREAGEVKALVIESPVVLTTSQSWQVMYSSPSIIRITGAISEETTPVQLTLARINEAAASGGEYQIFGNNTYSGGTVLSGSNTTVAILNGNAFGTGTLTFNGGKLVNSNEVVITNTVLVGPNSWMHPNGTLNYAAGNVTLSGNITGGGTFTTQSVPNTNNLYLAGNNSDFTGIFSNRAGTVYFTSASAGSTSAVWELQGGGTKLNFGGGTLRLGTLSSSSPWGALSPASTNYNYIVEVGARNENSEFRSQISGKTLALTKVGAGKLTLSFVNGTTYNDYWGATTINGGILSVAKLVDDWASCGIGSTGATVLDGGALEYTGVGDNCNRMMTLGVNGGALAASGTGRLLLSNNKAMTLVSGGPRTLTLEGSNTGTNTLAAILKDDTTNPTSLRKNGSGTWVLTGANTYTGSTTVDGGLLLVNGSLATGSAVGVNTNGTLGGKGIVNGTATVNAGGRIAPGNDGGTLVVSNLTMNTGAGFSARISSSVFSSGTKGYGRVKIPSAGTLTLSDFAVQVELLDGYTLTQPGLLFGIVQNETAGAIPAESFAAPEGATVYEGSDYILRVTYTGNVTDTTVTGQGTGNDIVLYSSSRSRGTAVIIL